MQEKDTSPGVGCAGEAGSTSDLQVSRYPSCRCLTAMFYCMLDTTDFVLVSCCFFLPSSD